jgi:hypothetical protein
MRQVDTSRHPADATLLEQMMLEQGFDNARQSRWLIYLGAEAA